MAFENHRSVLTGLAASVINAGQPVALVGAVTPASSRDEVVIPAASLNIDVFGVARSTQPTYGFPVDIVVEGVVKCVAAASLGAGVRVAVGSTNGKLIPLHPSGPIDTATTPVVAQPPRFVVGRALTAAVAGDTFSVLLDPSQII